MRYRKKVTEEGLIATGDRKRAAEDGARYVDQKRFKAIPAKTKKKAKNEEDAS